MEANVLSGQGANWIKGMVTVHIRGGQPEQLVNRALSGGLQLSSIRWTSSGLLEFELSVSDFFGLRPYLKETGCRVHVTKRKGLPFLLRESGAEKAFCRRNRIVFCNHIHAFITRCGALRCKGNVKADRGSDRLAAKEEGLYPMQWSFRLTDADVLVQAARSKASWFYVGRRREKRHEGHYPSGGVTRFQSKLRLNTPRHLVASADAVVTEIIAEAGRPRRSEKYKSEKRSNSNFRNDRRRREFANCRCQRQRPRACLV